MDTLQDLVNSMQNKNGKALSWTEGKETRSITYPELYENITEFSLGLKSVGMSPGDKISVFSKNLPEWIHISLGINNAGMVDVPRGEENSSEEFSYIVDHSETKMIIVDDESTLKKVAGKLSSEKIYTIKPVAGVNNISDIFKAGRAAKAAGESITQVMPDQSASIIYTSGTTGTPKGVELSHKNFVSNIAAVSELLPADNKDKNLSILPAWHVFERIAKYIFLEKGSETFYTTGRTLLKDLQTQKPTIMGSVPRIWEMVYDGAMKEIKSQGKFKSALIEKMLKMRIDYSANGNILKGIASLPLNFLLFPKVREKLGGNLRFAISGGSGLPKHIEDFFRVSGIKILEGYGMTETSPVIAVRSFYEDDRYTVGRPLKNLEIKISEEGVLSVRGSSVMKGYYKNQQATSEVLSDDGWLNTGDLITIDNKGRLKHGGRAKDLIKLSNGEYVRTSMIESTLKNSSYVDTAVVVGNEAKSIGALIVPKFDILAAYCKDNGIPFDKEKPEVALQTPEVKKLFDAEIKKYGTGTDFKPFEVVRNYALLAKTFTLGQELTPSMKVKRRVVEKLYAQEITTLLEK